MMDAEALGRLIDKYAATLVLYARQWCATPEDVAQDALLKLVAQKKPPQCAVAWLYGVVRKDAISAARSRKRRLRKLADSCLKCQPRTLSYVK
jgi:RNA polymerase sigma-70 factor (ECF subfamily)